MNERLLAREVPMQQRKNFPLDRRIRDAEPLTKDIRHNR